MPLKLIVDENFPKSVGKKLIKNNFEIVSIRKKYCF